ncbi:MAG: SDR family oxidoreductase [Proteobacteria bacterium]|nr:SDR family oxidoreductase [Pseudomonadota bacterium]
MPFLNSNASVVMISSMACHGGWKGLSGYSAAKAAVSVLAKSFSADLINRGIRGNSISPGFTDTPMGCNRNAHCIIQSHKVEPGKSRPALVKRCS